MPIIASNSQCQRKKLAKSHDFSRISFTILQKSKALTPLERRWFSFFVAAAKLGFEGTSVSIGELTDHEYRVSGQTHSVRTTFRALAGLEKKEFISRSRSRVGRDKFKTRIYFNPSAFCWYLKKPSSNVLQPRTFSHKNIPLPTLQKDSRTKNSGVLLSNSTSNLLDCKRRARTVNKNPKIASALLPILITLRAMVPGARRIAGVDRALFLDRAEAELISGDYISGVDWQYWANRPWKELPHEQRDNIAMTEIIPHLGARDYGKRPKDGRLDKLLSAFKSPPEGPPPEPIPREQVAVSRPPPDSSLETEEYRLLLEARERGRARSRAG